MITWKIVHELMTRWLDFGGDLWIFTRKLGYRWQTSWRICANNCCLVEYDLVGNLMFSQADEPQTHQSVLELSRNTGIHKSSVGHIICDLCRATHPKENSCQSILGQWTNSTKVRWEITHLRLEAIVFRILCANIISSSCC